MALQAKSQANSVSYPCLLLTYGIAVASVAVVLGLHLLLDSLFTHYSLLLILGATMLSASITLSAWYDGLGTGVLATLLSAHISDYDFVCPIHSFAGLGVETIPLLAYFLEGIFVSSLAATCVCPGKCVICLPHGPVLLTPPSTAAALSAPPFAPASP